MRLGTIALGAMLMSGLGNPATAQQRGNNDILITLRNAGNFTWFLRAVDGAKLTQQLKTGEYTVLGGVGNRHNPFVFRKLGGLPALPVDARNRPPVRYRPLLTGPFNPR